MKPVALSRRSIKALARFIHHEATAGLVLVAAAAAALVVSNSEALSPLYESFLKTPLRVQIGEAGVGKPLLLWINDGLMAIFFFLVGLEIKREVLDGHLSSKEQIVLPALAAVGGMAIPAAIYLFIISMKGGDPALFNGWAIPAATDIAFALGALALLGNRVPLSLKVFLLTLATLDDLGAIVIIALFYTAGLSLPQLALAGAALVVLLVMNRLWVTRIALYAFVGIALWLFVLKSGVHATLAGVVLALTIPLASKDGEPIIERLEEGLHPYVTWLILPLFAFANAGVSLAGFSPSMLTEALPLAVALGLLLGKPIGIVAACALAVRSGLSALPEGMRWSHLLGVSCLAGIGFTMSLFIGTLAFAGDTYAAGVRLGVIVGSLAAAVAGYGVLRFFAPPSRQEDQGD
ncbi:MAG: Na+/H+ antiporter NhaA [Parvibaculaceae bacterium]